MSFPHLLTIHSVSKFFGPATALLNVSASVDAGEVVALMGHNGAGKSTLVKILAGTIRPDGGEIRIEDRLVPEGVQAAREAGIAVIYQDLSLFPKLTIAENIAGDPIGGWRYSSGQVRKKAIAALERLEPGSVLLRCLESTVTDLPLAMRQRIAIARALARDSRILILDEPTASLSLQDSDRLLGCVRALANAGASILFVSHRMAEVRRIADRYLILRDGVVTLSAKAKEISNDEVTQAMFGATRMSLTAQRTVQSASKPSASKPQGPPALVVSGATRRGEFSDISLTLQAGQITLLSGLTGSGRTEFAESLVGLRRLERGDIQIFGKRVRPSSPREAMRAGLIYVPEDRLRSGLFAKRSVSENLLSVADHLRSRFGFLRREPGTASKLITRYEIQCRGPKASLRTLSGGNQQKVLLARWRLTQPRILILDEPTAGIDVSAKADIHARLRQWADDGAAVLIISSETEEVLALSDRVLVFHLGRLVMDRPRNEIYPEQLSAAMLHGNAME